MLTYHLDPFLGAMPSVIASAPAAQNARRNTTAASSDRHHGFSMAHASLALARAR